MYMTVVENKVTKDNNAKTMGNDARWSKCERMITRVYRDASGTETSLKQHHLMTEGKKVFVEFKESQAPSRRRR